MAARLPGGEIVFCVVVDGGSVTKNKPIKFEISTIIL